jgi:hypothetical protein
LEQLLGVLHCEELPHVEQAAHVE